jgi:hypothetical protein
LTARIGEADAQGNGKKYLDPDVSADRIRSGVRARTGDRSDSDCHFHVARKRRDRCSAQYRSERDF